MRSTPWKQSRPSPPRMTRSPLDNLNDMVLSLRVHSTHAKQAGIAERNRDDWRSKIVLVLILMQAHARFIGVEIDEASFGRLVIARKIIPDFQQFRRD